MAAEVSNVTNTGSYGQWQIVLDQVSQDFNANTSVVRVRGIIINNGSATSYNNGSVAKSVSGSGSWSGSGPFSVAAHSSTTFIDVSFTIGHDANGNATPSFTAHLGATGTGNIGGPTDVSASITLDRLASTPSAPGVGVDSITTTSARIVVSAPATDNRAGIDWYGAWVATDAGFTNVVSSAAGGTFTATGLTRATTYYARSQAHNAYGYSPYSGTATFTTAATVPDQPAAPTIGTVTQNAATVSFTLPGNGGSAITDTGFYLYDAASGGTLIAADTSTSPITTWTFTGLTPNTNYWAEVWAINAVGSGAHSARTLVTTRPSGYIYVSGAWHPYTAYVNISGTWHLVAETYNNVSGTWRS